jgi:heat shock protein HtpX
MNDFYSQQRRNRRVTALLMAGFFVLVALLALAVDLYTFGSFKSLGFPLATVLALSFASINGALAYYQGGAIVMKALGARPLAYKNARHRQLHNIVTEMALASGLPMPRVFVMDDPSPNAFATGRGPRRASIVVTEGLLEALSREELQAVVAHEMGHIRNLDILTMTVVSVLVGTVAILSDWAVRTWRYGGMKGRRRGKGLGLLVLIVIALFIIISPLVSRIIAMAVSRSREYLADASSAEFTRNPSALASALEKISGASTPLRAATRGTAHLFISDPMKRPLNERDGRLADLLSTHPPIESRVERLRKMAYIGERREVRSAGVSPSPDFAGA